VRRIEAGDGRHVGPGMLGEEVYLQGDGDFTQRQADLDLPPRRSAGTVQPRLPSDHIAC
jgi:hypothetical protein